MSNQASVGGARAFLENRKGHELYISDFAVHSICLLLFRYKQHHVFRQFLQDVMDRSGVGMMSLNPPELDALVGAAAKFHLDFDDAYQYSAAMKPGLVIVSFDADFDRTTEGRLLPTDAL